MELEHRRSRATIVSSSSSSNTAVFEVQAPGHSEINNHSQHIQQQRYTEEELNEWAISKAVFITNLPRHLDREKIFTTLSTITQREVKKFDLPNQNRIQGEFNKGFAYLHLKSEFRTRALLKKKFLKIGGNKVLIHPYRDHRGEYVPARNEFAIRRDEHQSYHYRGPSPRSRVNTGISNCDSGIQEPVHHRRDSPPVMPKRLSPIRSKEPSPNVNKPRTPPGVFKKLENDLKENAVKLEFANFSQNQRKIFYETYSQDKQKTIDTQQIKPVIQNEQFENLVQFYMAYYKTISSNKRMWTNEIHKFAGNNGFSFDFVVEKLTEHKKTDLTR